MLQYLKNKLNNLDEHSSEVALKSYQSTIVKIGAMIIGFFLSIALGRLLGPDGLGIINLSHRIIDISIVFGLLGMRQVIIKEVAIAHEKQDKEFIGNVMNTAYWLNGSLTLLLTVILILLSPWLAETVFNEPRLTFPLIIGFIALTPQVFSRILSSALIGYRKIWQSNLVDKALSTTITCLIIFLFWTADIAINVNSVALAYAIGKICVTVSIGVYWKKLYNFKAKRHWLASKMLTMSHSMLSIELSVIISSSAGILLIGALLNSKEVGLFTTANRLALLTSFFLQVTNSTVAPKIASLFELNKMKELEKMVRKVTGWLSVAGLLTLFLFVLFGNELLSLWGDEFTEAYWLLVILGIGQFINLATGAVGIILTMTGNEKIHRNISVFFMVISIPLSYIFIKHLGTIGAAIIFSLIIAGENVVKLVYAKTRVGIWSIPGFK